MTPFKLDRKQGSAKVEQVTAFMAELEKVVVTITITKAMENDLRTLIEAHMWSAEEGLRLVLGAGIGALLAEGVRDASTGAEQALALSRLLAEAQGKLAGARYELADAREQLRRWEMSSGAIAKIAQDVETTLRRQNSEIDALRAQLAQQEQLIQTLRGSGPAGG
jgi:chromosome segregation ATPase